MDTNSAESCITTRSAELMLKKKRKRARNKANRKERRQRLDQVLKPQEASKIEESSTEDLDISKKPKEELLPQGQLGIDLESAVTLSENKAVRKKKRRRRKVMSKKSDSCNIVPSVLEASKIEESSTEDMDISNKPKAELLPQGQLGIDLEPAVTLSENKAVRKKKKRRRKVMSKKGDSCNIVPSSQSLLDNKNREEENARPKRKLLILDVNGLLADVVHPRPKDCRPDACFCRRAIFKRPFCDDFLKFCFERFDVAIWSSRSKKIIVKVVNYLLGDLQQKLLFCWDMSHSTKTSFKTLDNKYKPLVCKELSRVWDRYDPRLPWERGDYDESNTLLVDDSPYKALLNPVHTAIFPHSYNFKAKNDHSLGPGGDLRIYLEELSKTEHVQKYVEQHPFGQRAIDDTNADWKFYSDVLCSLLGQSG